MRTSSLPRTDVPVLSRRTLLGGLVGAAAAGLTGCAGDPAGAGLAAAAPLPTAVAADTELVISIHQTHVALRTSGELGKLPFRVRDWPNIQAGPDVIQGFRARSIDLATNAGIPPIQARAINMDARIVAVQTRKDPLYVLATAPGSTVGGVGDLRGRKIGFSQGQAQGLVVLRTLKEQGLTPKDVKLVTLSSTQFLVALQSGQIDVAPLGEPTLTKYLHQYGPDGVGLRLAVTASWLILITVEQINALSGIGYLMAQAQLYAQTDVIVVGLAVYGVFGFTSDALLRLIERRALAWRRTLTS